MYVPFWRGIIDSPKVIATPDAVWFANRERSLNTIIQCRISKGRLYFVNTVCKKKS